MTDRDLTPAEEERVRRLLADARHTEPMPDEVVARLDGVLADLAETAGPRAHRGDLARRRRAAGAAGAGRCWWPPRPSPSSASAPPR